MAPPAPPPAPPPADDASVAVPAMFACVGMGIGAIAFGAGYGARSYFSTAAYKELVEKFPDLPTAEAEAAARKGATRAFLGGTALCGAFGLGAIITARMYGIKSAADFAEEIKKWLPTQAKLEVRCGAHPHFFRSLSLTRSLASRINTDGGGAEDRAAAADGDGAPAGRAQRGERPVPKERARPAVERARAELDQGADDDGGGEEINRAARGDGDTNAAQKVRRRSGGAAELSSVVHRCV